MTRPGGPTEAQHKRMHALWKVAGVTDRDDRLALSGALAGRTLTSSDDLTEPEAALLIRYMTRLHEQCQLVSQTKGWLERNGKAPS